MSVWIKLSDRFPEEADGYVARSRTLAEVLCYFADGAIESYCVEDVDSWNREHQKRGDNITHWQPLPEPPKESAE